MPVGPVDQFVVGVNPRSLIEVGRGFRGAQILTRSGPDGADSVLTETAIGDRIDLRFERVVIGSGDGYFADLVAWLIAAGLRHRRDAPWCAELAPVCGHQRHHLPGYGSASLIVRVSTPAFDAWSMTQKRLTDGSGQAPANAIWKRLIPLKGMAESRCPRAIRLCVELAELDTAEEGSPLARGEDERRAVRALAVTHGDDSGDIAGDLDTVSAVVAAEGTLLPCRPEEVRMD